MTNSVKLALISQRSGKIVKSTSFYGKLCQNLTFFYRLKRINLKETFFTLLGKNVFDVRNNYLGKTTLSEKPPQDGCRATKICTKYLPDKDLKPTNFRPISLSDFAQQWRKKRTIFCQMIIPQRYFFPDLFVSGPLYFRT